LHDETVSLDLCDTRPARLPRPDHSGFARDHDKLEKIEKIADKIEKVEKTNKPDRPEKPERPDR
jgi:hypothetical protein